MPARYNFATMQRKIPLIYTAWQKTIYVVLNVLYAELTKILINRQFTVKTGEKRNIIVLKLSKPF